jgi:hypothetical protein
MDTEAEVEFAGEEEEFLNFSNVKEELDTDARDWRLFGTWSLLHHQIKNAGLSHVLNLPLVELDKWFEARPYDLNAFNSYQKYGT